MECNQPLAYSKIWRILDAEWESELYLRFQRLHLVQSVGTRVSY